MVPEIKGTPRGSLIHRFVTSGKPGKCSLCPSVVEKLEAHHLCYSPEITINPCHKCHHTSHFWPNRLNDQQKKILLEKRFDPKTAQQLISEKIMTPQSLAKLIAPSRNAFIHAEQLKEQRSLQKSPEINHSQKITKLNKAVDLSFIKRVRRKK